MVESTLSLSHEDLRDGVYEYVHGGAGDYSAESDADRKSLVDKIVDSGLRQFYKPPPIGQIVHDWSFLKPVTTMSLNAPYTTGTIAYDHTGGTHERQVTLSGGTWPAWAAEAKIEISGTDYPVESRVSDSILILDSSDNPAADVAASTTYNLHQDDYDLPDDFGRIIGPITFAQADNAWYVCHLVGESRIREMRQRDSGYKGGDPLYASVRVKPFVPDAGTRQQILFWPIVQSSATITYQYRVRPNKPVSGTHYPYGGSDHSETVLYSCLAEAERRVDGLKGPMYERFMECLVASVFFDQKDNKPEVIGYNGDDSDFSPMFGAGRTSLYSSGVSHKDQV